MKMKGLCFFLFLFAHTMVYSQIFEAKPTWSQNFRSLRTSRLERWHVKIGPYEGAEHFTTDSIGNLYIRGGYLHLRATADKRGNKICSSSHISTLGFQSFLYGKLEVRAKTPSGNGIFPAIWMLREDHPKTFPLGEIDIMEYIECFKGSEYSTTTHIVEKEPGKKEIRHKHSKRVKADMRRFHVYGLEWTPTMLRFMLDKKEVYRLEKKDAEFWPFDDPYILILSLGFGSWGAQCGMDDTIFPCEMLIDWIRYYPLKDNSKKRM